MISPDIGGGFGGKVPVYPGYVIATAASVVTGKPVKWIEDRSENLQADSFARDYHITARLGASKGRLTALSLKTVADHGYSDAAANPSKFPAGLFHVCTGSYDLPTAHVEVDGVYTNKPPGGIAYRCSFRVTEAVHAIERMVDLIARESGEDPADYRLRNFIRPEQFPYQSALGWEYDSGDYGRALEKGMEMIGYRELRAEQARRREAGELMGIGISSFTEIVGAGPSKQFDILGIKMFDSSEIRIHPTGKAIARFGTKSQGQGHETTYAQIIAEELGIPPEDIQVEEGDTDTAPYGLGTYASRSTPTAGAAAAIASRRIRAKAKKIAAHLLEADEADLEWEQGRFFVKGSPDRAKTIQEIAFAAYTDYPQGLDAGLEAISYYDPPNLTFPFGSYLCCVDIDRGTGQVRIRRFVAVDDLRGPDQSDDRGRADPWRARDGNGPGAARGDLLRRRGQHPRRQLHGVPGSHGDGDAALGARRDGDPVATSPHRRQGGGRVGHRRRSGRDRECGCGRALASRRPPRRDSHHSGARMESSERGRRRGAPLSAPSERVPAPFAPDAGAC